MKDFGFTQPTRQQFAQAVLWQAEAPNQRWIFALREAVVPCVDKSKATMAGYSNRRLWWMFRADAVVPGCVPSNATPEDRSDNAEEAGG